MIPDINHQNGLHPQTSELGVQSSSASKQKGRIPGETLDVESIAHSVKTAEPKAVEVSLKSSAPDIPIIKSVYNYVMRAKNTSQLLHDYSCSLRSLTNRFALEGDKFKSYSGNDSIKNANQEFRGIAEKFIHTDDPSMKGMHKQRVLKAIENSFKSGLENTKEKLDMGEIIAVQIGFGARNSLQILPYKHSAGIVLFKNNGQYFLIKCDRGRAGVESNFAMSIYKISNPANINKAMKTLGDNQTYADFADGLNFYGKIIDKILSLEPFPDKETNGVQHKGGTIGNCPTTAGRMLMEGVAYADFSKNESSHHQALAKSNTFYKAFTTFDRNLGIEQVKGWVNGPDISDILTATYLPTHRDLLVAILCKASSKRNIELIMKLKDVVNPGIVREAILNAPSGIVLRNLFDIFKEMVTPERFLRVMKENKHFDLEKKTILTAQSIAYVLETVSNNPALKNDSEVQNTILKWSANKLIIKFKDLKGKTPKELEHLQKELNKFSDIPNFIPLIRDFNAKVAEFQQVESIHRK